ncbi:MAG: T9SS type A sorting domain-containing protein, partial [candidate division Zixibacteria bacterium]|nr:T9SS type A sorting domain-containing protein [candidate division Zixibacteria bacterium]
YSETPDEYYTSRLLLDNADEFDVLYAWWPAVAPGHSNTELADGQVLSVEAGYYNKPEDRFEFATLAGGDDVVDAGAARLDDVHPVPNPYFHATDLEPDAGTGLITFVGLPATEVTLEIYNLAGELIRTLTKDNLQSSRLTWDVKTTHGLPPASGIYIYRVVAPGVGSKVGKIAVFTEVEQVQRY